MLSLVFLQSNNGSNTTIVSIRVRGWKEWLVAPVMSNSEICSHAFTIYIDTDIKSYGAIDINNFDNEYVEVFLTKPMSDFGKLENSPRHLGKDKRESYSFYSLFERNYI